MPLNRNRPYGIISGTGVNASYEQADHDGKKTRYFDSEGLEIDIASGDRLEQHAVVHSDVKMAEADWADAARELLRQCDSMQFMQFAIKAAALIGGDNPPSNKKDIIAALQKRLDDMASGHSVRGAAKNGKAAPAEGEEISLAAFAKGAKKYVFTDVAKLIREQYSRDVSTIPDAVELLIEEGVVTSDEAMQV